MKPTTKWVVTMVVLAMLVGVPALLWGPFQPASAQTTTAADKIGIAASDMQIINQTQEPNDTQTMEVTLFTTSFKTSTPADLLIRLNAECGVYTAVGAKGNYDPLKGGTINTSSTAIGQVVVWLELDGVPV